MQEPPLHIRIHQCIRYGMCRMSAHLAFSEFSCAGSAPVIRLLSDELEQWALIHKAVEKSMVAADCLGAGLLSRIRSGNLVIGQLGEEMQGNTHRWLADENTGQRLQLGAIVLFRFHAFMAHSLLHMNHCESMLRGMRQQNAARVMESMDQCFSESPVTAAWIRQNEILLELARQRKG